MQRPFRTSSHGQISLILRSEPGKKTVAAVQTVQAVPSPGLGSEVCFRPGAAWPLRLEEEQSYSPRPHF